MMEAVVVDYGMGNLGSVRRSLEECGATVTVTGDPEEIRKASCIVLPGVGSFRDGMHHLKEKGLDEAIRKAASENGVPLLGICLGMQLLADRGVEGGECAGLGLIHGQTIKLAPRDSSEPIPHVGWNEVDPQKLSPLFEKIPSGADFYFVHSYNLVPADEKDILAVTPYCGRFVSAVSSENVYGVQFHPEKSSKRGFQLLRNFLDMARVGNFC